MSHDRIKKIQERGYENERICACGKDVPFLLAEIAKLTAERDAFDNALNNQAKLINLKETEYQDALARLKVADKFFEGIKKQHVREFPGKVLQYCDEALAEIKGKS